MAKAPGKTAVKRGVRTLDRATVNSNGPTETLVVDSEKRAFELLKAALVDELGDSVYALDFRGWPKLALRFSGKGYDSTITPDIAQALVDLQHALNRAYARVVHHSSNARGLTNEERREINFKAKVSKGSSAIEVNLGEYAEKLAQALAGKMSGTEIVVTVLGLALIAGGTLSFKAWMASRSEALKVEAEAKRTITLTQEETKRHQILADALGKSPVLAASEQDFHDVRRELLKSGGDASKVAVQGMEMQGVDARALASTPRTQSEDVQLNGHYTIERVDLHNPEFYRLSVVSQDGHGAFVAILNPVSLTKESRERLTSGTWDRARLYMQINGTRLRGEITTAAIVGVDWPKKG